MVCGGTADRRRLEWEEGSGKAEGTIWHESSLTTPEGNASVRTTHLAVRDYEVGGRVLADTAALCCRMAEQQQQQQQQPFWRRRRLMGSMT